MQDATSGWPRLPQVTHPTADIRRGVLLMIAVTMGYALIAALSKLLMLRYPVVMVAWARYAVPFAMTAFWLLRDRDTRVWRATDPAWQFLRSVLMIAGTILIMLAYHALPLAQALSISSIHPMLLTALAAIFLRERVGALTWCAVALGFAGVLVIVRPGGGMFTMASLLPLGMALTYAGYMALTRLLAGRETPRRSLLYGLSVGAALTTALLPSHWVRPDALAACMLALIGVLSGATHWLMIKALESAPASVLAPIAYVQLLWSIALGALFFGDLPNAATLSGIGIVIAAGLLLGVAQRPKGVPRRSQRCAKATAEEESAVASDEPVVLDGLVALPLAGNSTPWHPADQVPRVNSEVNPAAALLINAA